MAATTHLTSEQYLALPDQFDKSGNRIKDELIGGEIVRMLRLARVHRRERLSGGGRIFQGAPDLAIEIVPPSDTARRVKRKVDTYLEGGSKSVWVVYPDAKSVEVHSIGSTREFKGDRNIEDLLLPGFYAPVASFFDLT